MPTTTRSSLAPDNPGRPWRGDWSAAGRKVAIIERKLFGGTCVNTGCTPTKTLVASAYAAHVARRAADYGVTIERRDQCRHEGGQGAKRRRCGGVPAMASSDR